MRRLRGWATGAAVGLAVGSLAAAAVTSGVVAGGDGGLQHSELVGRARLPALTFGEAEPSGAQIPPGTYNGVTVPFPAQPVQGFSGVLRNGDGTYLAISDNGYGNKENSGDFLLRVHHIRPDFAGGGISVLGGFGLSDPDGRVPWPLTRADRRLTGADFDPESFQRLPDGTFWFGDEFGPFLLHTDATGRLLGAPVPLPGVKSPQSPLLAPGEQPTLARSKGFEAMALEPGGRFLYPLLEGPVAGDHPQTLRMYEFDTERGRYTSDRRLMRMEHPNDAVADLVAVGRHRFIAIERDPAEGPNARLKALFGLQGRDRDGDGFMDKHLLVNLVAIPDPRGIGGDGAFYRFFYEGSEAMVVVDDQTVAVMNDNNLPFSSARTPGAPDENEMILVRLDQPLRAAWR